MGSLHLKYHQDTCVRIFSTTCCTLTLNVTGLEGYVALWYIAYIILFMFYPMISLLLKFLILNCLRFCNYILLNFILMLSSFTYTKLYRFSRHYISSVFILPLSATYPLSLTTAIGLRFTDRVSSKVLQLVVSVCLSVRLFLLYILNNMPFDLDLDFCMCMGHDHSYSRALKVKVVCQGQYLGLRLAVGLGQV